MNTEQLALLRTILDNPDDDTTRLVYADWLEENGKYHESSKWRLLTVFDVFEAIEYRKTRYGYGDGDGRGYGCADGCGNGNGYGYGYGDGRGYGCGDGYGDGSGDGCGNGSGNGNGNGNGYGAAISYFERINEMVEIGGQYVFMCPGWYVFAGRVKEVVGPYEYILESAVMVLNNGGHGWGKWAGGTRSGSRVQRCGEVFQVGGPFAGIYHLQGDIPLEKSKSFDVVTL